MKKINLDTGESSFHVFEKEKTIKISENGIISEKFKEKCFNLLKIPTIIRNEYQILFLPSGKAAIKSLANALPQNKKILIFSDDNYACHKDGWSAIHQLKKAKTEFEVISPELGVGIGSEHIKNIIENTPDFIWIVINETSTGTDRTKETIDLMKKFDKKDNAPVFIIDAASFPLLTDEWEDYAALLSGGAIFFSLRKQPAVFYEGKQTERSGSMVVIKKELLSKKGITEIGGFSIEKEQKIENEKLLETISGFDDVLEKTNLKKLDATRKECKEIILEYFSENGKLGRLGCSLVPSKDMQSSTAYIVKLPGKIKPADFVEKMKEKDIIITTPSHPMLKESAVRFAVYSATTKEDVKEALDKMADVII